MSQAINFEAGTHDVTTDPRELVAAVDAGVRTWNVYPYFEARYGGRGRRFTRSDSAWLVTLASAEIDAARRQIKWLASLLAARGMPSLLFEEHLFHLREALVEAVPERAEVYGRLAELVRSSGPRVCKQSPPSTPWRPRSPTPSRSRTSDRSSWLLSRTSARAMTMPSPACRTG